MLFAEKNSRVNYFVLTLFLFISLSSSYIVCVFKTTEQFLDRAVSYQQFSENPSIIDDPNLVVKVGNKYALFFQQVFQLTNVFI